MKALSILSVLVLGINLLLMGQSPDSIKNNRFSIHAQATVINQTKLAFDAPYSGQNSLIAQKENQTSITSTLYAGVSLWKGASVFINPEIAGGSGLSQALGVAAALNGETFRIGSPAPQIYLARLFWRQRFTLSKETISQESNFNQLKENIPEKYLALTIGKIGLADFFDNNKYSHDPRTQFTSWALMDAGAWDYAANTRGYTPSVVMEYISPVHEIRYGLSLVPLTANGLKMNWNISKASSHTLEYTHHHKVKTKEGAVRLLLFFTTANMGNYKKSIALNPQNPVIENTRVYGNTKYGFVINAEQGITNNLGAFVRASWNDGNNETWMFTEIDRSISAGFSLSGEKWNRKNDHIGLAYVTSGISKPHRDYLKAGGKGFILGDGNLTYKYEQLTEFSYNAEVLKAGIYISGVYQFLLTPGYNHDRKGPVHIFSVRFHLVI